MGFSSITSISNFLNFPRRFNYLASLILLITFFEILLLHSNFAYASTSQKLSAFVICKNKKNVRTLRIFPDEKKNDNCTVTYSKGAIEEVVGSNRSTSTCNSILKNIQFNPEAAKWSCRSVQSAEVTLGSEVSHQ